jgi:aryl-alcohol dehydrogenase-like predicted oxidoreductase
LTYGIANRVGKPDAQACKSLLSTAWTCGISIYDTAQAYGDSERILGDYFVHFPSCQPRFISKLHPAAVIDDPAAIRLHVHESLRRLRTRQLWALLLHREAHFDHWQNTLGAVLKELRQEGLVKHLGLSAYSPEVARAALLDPDIGVVSIPASVFDRRMKRAGLDQLAREQNKLLVLRSIFLQGLACLQPAEVPHTVPGGAAAVSVLNDFCRARQLEPREFAYDYVRACFPDGLVTIGAETPEQIAQNCELANRSRVEPGLVEAWDETWPKDTAGLHNPAMWESAAKAKERESAGTPSEC